MSEELKRIVAFIWVFASLNLLFRCFHRYEEQMPRHNAVNAVNASTVASDSLNEPSIAYSTSAQTMLWTVAFLYSNDRALESRSEPLSSSKCRESGAQVFHVIKQLEFNWKTHHKYTINDRVLNDRHNLWLRSNVFCMFYVCYVLWGHHMFAHNIVIIVMYFLFNSQSITIYKYLFSDITSAITQLVGRLNPLCI